MRQAGARTNDLAGDGCTTSIILAQGLIAEGVKVWIEWCKYSSIIGEKRNGDGWKRNISSTM